MGDPVGEMLCIHPCTVMEELCVCVYVCVCVRACMSECIWCVCVCVCVIKVAASSVKASEEKSTTVNSLGKR